MRILDNVEGLLILGAIAAGLYLAWSSKEAVKAAASAVNPLNNNNAISTGANAVVGLDNKTASIGTKIFDWLNPSQPAFTPGKEAPLVTDPIKPVPVRK